MTKVLSSDEQAIYSQMLKETKESLPNEIKKLIEGREACELKIACIIEGISANSTGSVPTKDPALMSFLREKASYDSEIRELERQRMAIEQLK